jgi:hypothetical protein
MIISLLAMRTYFKPLPNVKETHQITIRNGKLFLIDQGNFIMLTSPIILENGVVITVEGLMNLPDGRKRMLLEGEYM